MSGPDKRTELRKQAEAVVRNNASPSRESIDAQSLEATWQMLHELRVHQIELEMQNEELRCAQLDLYASQARYFDLYDLAPVGYCTVSDTGLIQQVNLTAANFLGLARGALFKQPFSRVIHKEDQDIYYRFRKQLLESGESQSCELRLCKSNGSPFWAHLTATSAVDANVPVLRIALSDITERRQLEEEVRQLAFHDPLTKLPNRRLLDDRLSLAMAASARSGCYGALMYLDLDNFKQLNDSYGHVVGDVLLIEVASRLKASVRGVDTVARFGGDEFVVMISALDTDRAASMVEARIVAEKIVDTLSKPYRLVFEGEDQSEAIVQYQCTLSVGVVLFINHVESQINLLKWADRAMYRAKKAGGGAIWFHE